ncbi:MAG: hypothetical protein NTV70_21820, partial [Acidobacteria bacterium]|nr:hypothetical protein [Acidobacteriota bacterium]
KVNTNTPCYRREVGMTTGGVADQRRAQCRLGAYFASRKQMEKEASAELDDSQPAALRGRLEAVSVIQAGIEADQDGLARPAREALQELDDKLGLPR